MLLDLLYPRRCASCSAPGRTPWCDACEAAAPWIDDACIRCALPACRGCDGRGAAFDAAASAGVYDGPVRDALLAFKLLGDRRAAAALAARMHGALKRANPGAAPAAITYVPSTPAVERARGFNPARLLAIALARTQGLPALTLLRKTRRTPDLAGLDRTARRAALRDAFAAAPGPPPGPPPGPLPGRVALIDDVLTTGATASACAVALKAAGVHAVSVVTFARSI